VPFYRDHRQANEPLVDCGAHKLLCQPYYSRTDGVNFPYSQRFVGSSETITLRQSVVDRLKRADALLRPYAVRLCLLDGYRSIKTQQAIWDFYCSWVAQRHSHWTSQKIIEFAARFASDPRSFDAKNPKTWPVHCTGGAVDLTLVSLDGKHPIFMGSIFDDPAPVSATAYFEHKRVNEDSASEMVALRYRRLLYHVMIRSGFENYSAEWWHYDWGTQLWAFFRAKRTGRRTRAIYRYIEPNNPRRRRKRLRVTH